MMAGGLRHRVTFQNMVVTQGAAGGVVKTPKNHVTLWAAVEYLGGKQYWQAKQANSEAQGRVRIRHRTDIDPTMRIKYGTKTLELIAPFTYDTKNSEMHILFKEALD